VDRLVQRRPICSPDAVASAAPALPVEAPVGAPAEPIPGVSKSIWDGKPISLDASQLGVSKINRFLQHDVKERGIGLVRIERPCGMHNLAVGLDSEVEVHILGHSGYYVAGMNKRATVVVHGNVERGAAENMMSGLVRITGNASEAAGGSAHGGLLVVEGDVAGRCGISLKGGDIVVGGNAGHAAMFMAQAGRLLIRGDAGPGLGDSLYEAVIYIAGNIEGLGADARLEPMTDADRAAVDDLLSRSGLSATGLQFKRVASGRTLYHWNSGNHSSY
jgi:methylamine---glutamate N-methyltransferase subunit B